jgi:hypothetical protein
MATVKTTVNLPEAEYEDLKSLAGRREISFTHALRQAIQSELFIQRLVDEGAALLAQTPGGELQRIVFTQASAPAQTTTQAVAARPTATA